MAESVDASDLKCDWANNSVPVQVWPGAPLKTELILCLFYCLDVNVNKVQVLVGFISPIWIYMFI